MCKFRECFLVPSSGWIWKVLSCFRFTAWHLYGYLCHLLAVVCLWHSNYDCPPSSSCEYPEEIALWQGFTLGCSSWTHLGKDGGQKSWWLWHVFILVFVVLDAFALRTLVARHVCLARGRKTYPWNLSSAVSWIVFVSRRFWGTQKEALHFFKVAQKARMSGELWRANILLFEASVLIFDILTLKKRYRAMLLSFVLCRAKGLCSVSEGLVSRTRTQNENGPPWEPSDWSSHSPPILPLLAWLLATGCEARAAEKWRGWILGSQRAPPGSSSSRWSSWEETESWHLPGEPKTLKKSMSGNECCTELQEMP